MLRITSTFKGMASGFIFYSYQSTTLLHQLPQQPTPFLPEEVGSRQAAISTDHTQVGDAVLHQVVSSLQASLVSAKLFAAGAANNSPALMRTS